MQIAILLYDRFTALDAVGPYEVLSRLPGAEVVFAAQRPGPVRTDTGMLAVTADAALADVPHPDIVLVPGGPGQEAADDRRAGARVAARGRRGQHLDHLGLHRLADPGRGRAAGRAAGPPRTGWPWTGCAEFGAQPVSERVVIDGKYVTGGRGVSGHRHGARAGRPDRRRSDAAQAIQLMLEYDPQPPYTAGSPRTAPPDLVTSMRRQQQAHGG